MWRDRRGRVHVSAEEARGGEIILRTPTQRAVFLSGLIGVIVLALAAIFAGGGCFKRPARHAPSRENSGPEPQIDAAKQCPGAFLHRGEVSSGIATNRLRG